MNKLYLSLFLLILAPFAFAQWNETELKADHQVWLNNTKNTELLKGEHAYVSCFVPSVEMLVDTVNNRQCDQKWTFSCPKCGNSTYQHSYDPNCGKCKQCTRCTYKYQCSSPGDRKSATEETRGCDQKWTFSCPKCNHGFYQHSYDPVCGQCKQCTRCTYKYQCSSSGDREDSITYSFSLWTLKNKFSLYKANDGNIMHTTGLFANANDTVNVLIKTDIYTGEVLDTLHYSFSYKISGNSKISVEAASNADKSRIKIDADQLSDWAGSLTAEILNSQKTQNWLNVINAIAEKQSQIWFSIVELNNDRSDKWQVDFNAGYQCHNGQCGYDLGSKVVYATQKMQAELNAKYEVQKDFNSEQKTMKSWEVRASFKLQWREKSETAPKTSEEVVTQNARVDRAKALYNQGKVYSQGCSGFVSEVLGISWDNANNLMGSNPIYVGTNNNYSGLKPGDVIGWKSSSGSGHVAIYIGDGEAKIIDVPGSGQRPRKIMGGYGGQALYKSSRY
ncbi:MAG: hypothetical protein HUU50_06740 [Candidatus Brocadiae bacterium]|nr:hypothetical protein [Candidatus Brocadiia bacterium]